MDWFWTSHTSHLTHPALLTAEAATIAVGTSIGWTLWACRYFVKHLAGAEPVRLRIFAAEFVLAPLSGVEFRHRRYWMLEILTITAEMHAQVARLLGREPRGLEAIAVAAVDGSPMVIRVASLVDDTPFPTLFWLVDPDLNYRIDQVEAAGLIKQFQRRVNEGPQLQQQMKVDHQAHIALRAGFISTATGQRLSELGFGEVLQQRGIGGIADYQRIRCLHTWYASHLVVPNTIGSMLDQWWQEHEGIAQIGSEQPASAD